MLKLVNGRGGHLNNIGIKRIFVGNIPQCTMMGGNLCNFLPTITLRETVAAISYIKYHTLLT